MGCTAVSASAEHAISCATSASQPHSNLLATHALLRFICRSWMTASCCTFVGLHTASQKERVQSWDVHIISFNTHECSTTTAMAVPQGKTATNYTHKPPPTCNIATRCTSRTCHSPLQSSCRLEKLYVLVQQRTKVAALVRGHLFKAAGRCCICQRNTGSYRQSHYFPRFCLQSMAP